MAILKFVPYVMLGATALVYCTLGIYYMESISQSCEKLSVDLRKLRRGINQDTREVGTQVDTPADAQDGSSPPPPPPSSSSDPPAPGHPSAIRTRRHSPSPPHSAHDLQYFRFA